MQESQETHISNHLDEIVAAVSITPRKKLQNKLPQTALFQPPREKLHLCEEKAKSYSSSHEYKQALQELVRCVALTRICYGDSHWKLAEAHVNLAQGYLQLKGLSLQAKQHAEKAKEILTNSIVHPYNDNTDVFKCSVELFHTMGRALLSLQKFKEASENLTKAERLSKELLQCGRIIKEEWIEIQTQIKLSFAQVYQGQKKSKEALPHYQEALEYIEISKGEKSLECVPTLRELAGVEQALGFHNASINHLLQGSPTPGAQTGTSLGPVRNGAAQQEAHLIVLSRNPSQEEAAVSAHSVACAAVASGRPEHHDVAEQYFQDSMANLKDAEGIGKAKFLSIQDDYCHFLQVTGQKEIFFSTLTCQWDFPGGPVVKNPLSSAGDAGLIPGQGTKIPRAVGQQSLHTITTELAQLNKRAHMPQTTEPTHPGARVPQLERENLHAATREKPMRHNERSRMPQLRPDAAK
ncbi:tetratricopeptide repeat protein 23 isoform X2 [Physeter macrocephalus]|uniref:Tetratricopeptide repeat protein 23 isoform X2 n=1 Tax=Physeter macrocephalus TaxID=9755 RepID=A0A9W2WY68_PHYMC|nr:tetratricopeptide repeat protein 23 isoform X2 [Physeter catodon]